MSERIVQQPINTQVQAKFSDLPVADVERSTFDMSHSWKGTMEQSTILPILNMEVLPGDTFSVNSTVFVRLATPIKPIMDNLTADVHYFFVPHRLVWDNFQKFMGERDNPDDDPSEVSFPVVQVDLNINNVDAVFGVSYLCDAFGLPLYDPGNTDPVNVPVNALPFRSYALIWNEWYRNQNLQNVIFFPKGDGNDGGIDLYEIAAPRLKRADYFTRALPWPQKGDPVFLPLGTEAPVVPIFQNNDSSFYFKRLASASTDNQMGLKRDENDPFEVAYVRRGGGTFNPGDIFEPAMNVDLTQATAATINDIRTAFQIQKLLERDARGGTRYIEIILSHFNVQSPDARLQRPEFLGSGKANIAVNPVAATAETENSPQGNLAAVGTGLLKGGFTHSFTEHGLIMGLLSVRHDPTYQRGMERMWSRRTRYDFYWPSLSHLGEQPILNKEIFFDDALSDNDNIWGYQERYAEYRYQPSRITGLFRSEDPQSLDVWHLSQDFASRPNLNGNFVIDDAPIERISAVPSEPDFLIDAWHKVSATRPMPVYAVPGLVDHF